MATLNDSTYEKGYSVLVTRDSSISLRRRMSVAIQNLQTQVSLQWHEPLLHMSNLNTCAYLNIVWLKIQYRRLHRVHHGRSGISGIHRPIQY